MEKRPEKEGQAHQRAKGEDDDPVQRDFWFLKSQTRYRGHRIGPDEPEADPGQ